MSDEIEVPRKNGMGTGSVGPGKPPLHTRFQLGNPGRPKGSRNKLGEDFIAALYEDFHAHGVAAIAEARQKDPVAYVRVVAGLLPKEMKVRDERDLTDEQLEARIQQLAKALNLEIRPITPTTH